MNFDFESSLIIIDEVQDINWQPPLLSQIKKKTKKIKYNYEDGEPFISPTLLSQINIQINYEDAVISDAFWEYLQLRYNNNNNFFIDDDDV